MRTILLLYEIFYYSWITDVSLLLSVHHRTYRTRASKTNRLNSEIIVSCSSNSQMIKMKGSWCRCVTSAASYRPVLSVCYLLRPAEPKQHIGPGGGVQEGENKHTQSADTTVWFSEDSFQHTQEKDFYNYILLNILFIMLRSSCRTCCSFFKLFSHRKCFIHFYCLN